MKINYEYYQDKMSECMAAVSRGHLATARKIANDAIAEIEKSKTDIKRKKDFEDFLIKYVEEKKKIGEII